MEKEEKKKSIVAIKDLQGYLSLEELDSIINCARYKRDRLLLKLMKSSGRRISEIVGRKNPVEITWTHKGITKTKIHDSFKGLTPSDINYKKKLIRFRIIKKKTETYKLKTIDDSTFDELIEYIQRNEIQLDQEIFDISRQRAFQIVRECADRAGVTMVGVKQPHPHHFRHSFAVNMLESTNDPTAIRKIQQALEHSNLNVTAVYLQFKQEDIREMQNITFGGKKNEKNKSRL